MLVFLYPWAFSCISVPRAFQKKKPKRKSRIYKMLAAVCVYFRVLLPIRKASAELKTITNNASFAQIFIFSPYLGDVLQTGLRMGCFMTVVNFLRNPWRVTSLPPQMLQ